MIQEVYREFGPRHSVHLRWSPLHLRQFSTFSQSIISGMLQLEVVNRNQQHQQQKNDDVQTIQRKASPLLTVPSPSRNLPVHCRSACVNFQHNPSNTSAVHRTSQVSHLMASLNCERDTFHSFSTPTLRMFETSLSQLRVLRPTLHGQHV